MQSFFSFLLPLLKQSYLTVALLLSFFSSTLLAHSSPLWMHPYAEAVEKSQRSGLPLLLFFTTADEEGWCGKLNEVLDSKEFTDLVQGRLNCVEILLPKDASQGLEELAYHYGLKERFMIQEYPRLVLLTPDERVLTKVGFLPGSGKEYAHYFLEILERDKRVAEVVKRLHAGEERFTVQLLEKCYKEAQELQRGADASYLLEKGLKSKNPLFFLIEKYRILALEDNEGRKKLRTQILELDEGNKEGSQFSLALIDFQNSISAALPVEESIKPLERYLRRFGKSDKENCWRIEMMIAQYYLEREEASRALNHAEMAYECAPTPRKEEIGQTIDYIKVIAQPLAQKD